MLIKNQTFRHKFKFSTKIKISVKDPANKLKMFNFDFNQNFGPKRKILVKNKILVKQKRNFGLKNKHIREK